MSAELRLDVDAQLFEASLRAAQLALLRRLREVRNAVFWCYLIPPLGWSGRLDRLLLEQDSHAKASANLGRHIARVEEIRKSSSRAEPVSSSPAEQGGE